MKPLFGSSSAFLFSRRAAGFLAGGALGFVVLITVAAGYIGLDDVAAQLQALSAFTMASVLALCLFDLLSRAVRWNMYCIASGVEVGLARALVFYFAGYSMSLTPGRLGELVRLWFLRRSQGYPLRRLAPLYVADRAADANAYVWLIVIAAASYPGYGVFAGLLSALVLAGTALLAYPRPLSWFLRRAYEGLGCSARIFAFLRMTLRQGAKLFRFSVYGPTVLVGTLGYMAVGLALHRILTELGSPLGVAPLLFVLGLAFLAGGLSMMPGGLGGTDAAIFSLLAYAGIPPSAALVATASLRIAHLWFAVALGIAMLPVALQVSASRIPKPGRKIS